MKFSDYGIQVNDSGHSSQKVTCPECTPRRKKKHLKDLSVNLDLGVWFCHHCGWSGGLNKVKISSLYKKYEYKPMKKSFLKPPEFKSTKISDKALAWFSSRGISKETIEKNGVCSDMAWMPQTQKKESCVIFQYYIDGILINRKYRDGVKNFRMEKDCRLVLYAPWQKYRKQETDTLYITEGEIDALTLLQCGYKDVVSIPNGAPDEKTDIKTIDFAYLESLPEIMPKYKNVILVMDSDKVGSRLRDEIARRLGKSICKTVEYPDGCKDINEVLKKYDIESVRKIVDSSEFYPISGKHKVESVYKGVLNLYDNGFTKGAMTGWHGIDSIYSPREGYFTVVTGIPNHGKSNWMDSLMVNMSKINRWKFSVYSPENYPFERHIANLCEKIVGKPFQKTYKGHMEDNELFEALEFLNKYFIFIMPAEDDQQSLENIIELAKSSVLQDGVNGIMLDPWNEMEHEFGNDSETIYTSKALSKIRRFARFNNVHVWLIAHPMKLQKNSKTGGYDAPTPYDISGSANWRNKPDHILCVHRPDFSNNVTEIHSQKVRFREMGKVDVRELVFDIKSNSYK